MKIAAISDLHGDFPEIKQCDLVLICGDIIPLDRQNNINKSLLWFKHYFIPWCESLPCDKVIFIAGNHDFALEYLSYNEI